MAMKYELLLLEKKEEDPFKLRHVAASGRLDLDSAEVIVEKLFHDVNCNVRVMVICADESLPPVNRQTECKDISGLFSYRDPLLGTDVHHAEQAVCRTVKKEDDNIYRCFIRPPPLIGTHLKMHFCAWD